VLVTSLQNFLSVEFSIANSADLNLQLNRIFPHFIPLTFHFRRAWKHQAKFIIGTHAYKLVSLSSVAQFSIAFSVWLSQIQGDTSSRLLALPNPLHSSIIPLHTHDAFKHLLLLGFSFQFLRAPSPSHWMEHNVFALALLSSISQLRCTHS
jgi:hypothetical protein